jgi:hypothetical protein
MTILQFINVAAGTDSVAVGKSLNPCTDQIRSVSVTHPKDGHRIVFIDSPGFDDAFVDDAVRLKQISNWLKKK